MSQIIVFSCVRVNLCHSLLRWFFDDVWMWLMLSTMTRNSAHRKEGERLEY